MYPKLFIENFWRGEENNTLFVCMPIDDGKEFDKKFKDNIEPVKERISSINEVVRADHRKDKEITQQILDDVAHSKILLFDLSKDLDSAGQINGNVLYELGFATTIRDKSDMLLIREGESLKPGELPFDIRELPIESYSEKELTIDWVESRLKRVLDNKDWQKNKLLEIAKNSMEPVGFILMDRYYQQSQIFDRDLSNRERLAALRLIDLGILKGLPAVRGEHSERLEYSYCWTQFGEALKRHLELNKRRRD